MSYMKTLSEELEEWALCQKRITNKMIRDRFDVDYEFAQDYYDYLKQIGVIGYGGYVVQEVK